MKNDSIILCFALCFAIVSCKKDAGEGGTSTITGKILKRDYNGTFPFFYEEFPAVEQDIYIIYGDEDNTYDNRTRCSYDGSFQFDYLRNGNYKVFVYSYDTLSLPGDINTDTVIVRSVEITKKKSTEDAGTITIIKN